MYIKLSMGIRKMNIPQKKKKQLKIALVFTKWDGKPLEGCEQKSEWSDIHFHRLTKIALLRIDWKGTRAYWEDQLGSYSKSAKDSGDLDYFLTQILNIFWR